MKLMHWHIRCATGLCYGPFKTPQQAIKQALKHHGFSWVIEPVWKPL